MVKPTDNEKYSWQNSNSIKIYSKNDCENVMNLFYERALSSNWNEQQEKKVYRVFIGRRSFVKAPPPEIPIKENDDTEFIYDNVSIESYNQDGAKVHVVSTIICNGKTYHIECNVKWDEKLKQHKVKNAQIVPVGDHVTV